MAWPPRFLFITNRLGLDLALTGGTGRYAKFERLHGPADLADWFAACELGVRIEGVTAADVTAARELRGAIWDTARAALRGRALGGPRMGRIEAFAAVPDLVPTWARGRLAWAAGSTSGQALSSVARDALAFFGGEGRERLRECANPACPLFFVDTSRPGRRAWCSMERCGNLHKTARYRARKRAPRGDDPGVERKREHRNERA